MLLNKYKLRRLTLQEYIDVFKTFDTDDDGNIDLTELKYIWSKIGDKLKPAEIDEFISKLDFSADSKVGVGDLWKILKNQN